MTDNCFVASTNFFICGHISLKCPSSLYVTDVASIFVLLGRGNVTEEVDYITVIYLSISYFHYFKIYHI